MNCKRESLLVYGVTDKKWLNGRSIKDVVELAINGGATFMQLREKDLKGEELLSMAKDVKSVCNKHNIPYVINDDVKLAIEVGADGIHIGQSDMKYSEARKVVGDEMIIGVSVINVEQALEAESLGADYLGVGAVFPTGSKDDADYVNFETLKTICESVKIPVVAIGGITKQNLHKLESSGICGIAVISEIFAQDDIEKATKELADVTKKHLG